MIKKNKTISIQDMPFDTVTGLYNESFFLNRLNFSLSGFKDINGCLFAVIAIALDQDGRVKNRLTIEHWKSILRETARTIGTTVRPTDTLARFQEDNFYILIQNVPDQDIPRQIASRIQERLIRQLAEAASGLLFPFRIGILLCGNHYKKVEQILHDVDHARSLANPQEVCFFNDLEMTVR